MSFRPRKSSLSYAAEDDDVEEEADEVVPDGVEEVELARIDLEHKEQVQKLILDDIRKLSLYGDTSGDVHPEKEDNLWMIVGGRTILVSNFVLYLQLQSWFLGCCYIFSVIKVQSLASSTTMESNVFTVVHCNCIFHRTDK